MLIVDKNLNKWYNGVLMMKGIKMAFNWQVSSLEETVDHVLKSSYAAVSRARKYYIERGYTDVVAKIDKARKIAVTKRLEVKLESLK